jgi:hypothetical protein
MITIYAFLAKNNIDEYLKKHYFNFQHLKLYSLFFKYKNNDDAFLIGNAQKIKQGDVILLDKDTANIERAMLCIKNSYLRYNNTLGFAEYEKKANLFDLILKPFDGELPYKYSPTSRIFDDTTEHFNIISYIAAGHTCKPINPNLISSWGYSFDYNIL